MRAAFCLSGKVGGIAGKDGLGRYVDFAKCAETYFKHIINKNNCDVFMHCWDTRLEKQLVNLYHPVSHKFEPQIRFKTKSTYHRDMKDEFIIQSKWYSVREVIKLKQEYEQKNNFIYDWVMLCRYDLVFLTNFDFSILNNKYFYLSNYNDGLYKGRQPNKENYSEIKRRCLEMWFLCSSSNMNKLSLLYDKFDTFLNRTDPHTIVWQYIHQFIDNPAENIKYILYRWFDYELYRIKICGWKT